MGCTWTSQFPTKLAPLSTLVRCPAVSRNKLSKQQTITKYETTTYYKKTTKYQT